MDINKYSYRLEYSHEREYGRDYSQQTTTSVGNISSINNKFTNNTKNTASKKCTQSRSVRIMPRMQSRIAANGKKTAFFCPKCPGVLSRKDVLSRHLLLHGSNNMHKCKFCDYAVRTCGNLIKHRKNHHGLDDWKMRKHRSDNDSIESDGSDNDDGDIDGSDSNGSDRNLLICTCLVLDFSRQ